MSLDKDKNQAKILIFFKLRFSENQLQQILDSIDDYEIVGTDVKTEVGQIQIGPPRIYLGNLYVEDRLYKIHYNIERFQLTVEGNLENLDKVFKLLMNKFKLNYSLKDTCRFMEFDMEYLLEEQGLLEKLQKKIDLHTPEKIEKNFGVKLNTWGLVLASSKSPLNDNWFSLRMLPEALSSSGRVVLRIIKREEKSFSEMHSFLKKVKDIEEMITEWLE